MSTQQKGWPVKNYWIKFDPKTSKGAIWLNMNDSSAPELNVQDISPQEVAALAVILGSGRARYMPDGSIMVGSDW